MTNKRRRGRIRAHGGKEGADDKSGEQRLEHLRQGFEAFRREHRPGTQISQAPPDEALAALSSGTPEIEVQQPHWRLRILPGWGLVGKVVKERCLRQEKRHIPTVCYNAANSIPINCSIRSVRRKAPGFLGRGRTESSLWIVRCLIPASWNT